jgi:hypothetical protein
MQRCVQSRFTRQHQSRASEPPISDALYSTCIPKGGFMLLRFGFAIALCVCGTIRPAIAGWQWTEWGMTPDQVKKVAAAKGLALTVAPNSHPDRIELNTPYEAVSLKFRARLIFNQNASLTEVVLEEFNGSQCHLLEDFVKSSYGAPYDTGMDGQKSWAWRDDKDKDDVMLRLVGPDGEPPRWCDLQYSSLADHHQLGL